MAMVSFSFKKCVLVLCPFVVFTEMFFSVVVGATSTGPRTAFDRFDGLKKRRNADDNSVALPSSEFFIEEIVNSFGFSGQLSQKQLQFLLQRVGAEVSAWLGVMFSFNFL